MLPDHFIGLGAKHDGAEGTTPPVPKNFESKVIWFSVTKLAWLYRHLYNAIASFHAECKHHFDYQREIQTKIGTTFTG